MAPIEEQAWKGLAEKILNTGVQGLELNLGCPHGMCERGMGSAVGQVPEMVEQTTRWVKTVAGKFPVFTPLTPNTPHNMAPRRAAKRGGAAAGATLTTVNSILNAGLTAI